MLSVNGNDKMTFSNFISRLSWRQILLHSIAFWFFIHAFETFSYLKDTKLIELYRHSNEQITETTLEKNGMSVSNMSDLLIGASVAGFIGLGVSFIISLAISIKRHWLWVNSMIALLIMFIPVRFGYLHWHYLKEIFWAPGQIFNNTKIEFILNGIILLTIGLLIFFWRLSNRFIRNNKPVAA